MIILLFCADFRARIGRVEIDGFSHICLALLNIKTSTDKKNREIDMFFFFLSFLSSLRYCCQHRYASPPIVSRITTELPLLDASPRFLFFRAKQQIGERCFLLFQVTKTCRHPIGKKKKERKSKLAY